MHLSTSKHGRTPDHGGYTLTEMLIVVTLIGIVAAVAIPSGGSNVSTELQATAEVVVAELDYARSLAVTYGSSYEVKQGDSRAEIVVQHTGSDSSLDTLPPGPFESASDAADEHVIRLSYLGGVNTTVALLGITTYNGSAYTNRTNVEFDSFGETTQTEATTFWLVAGKGDGKRYVAVEIDPITGLAAAEEPTASPPSAAVAVLTST